MLPRVDICEISVSPHKFDKQRNKPCNCQAGAFSFDKRLNWADDNVLPCQAAGVMPFYLMSALVHKKHILNIS